MSETELRKLQDGIFGAGIFIAPLLLTTQARKRARHQEIPQEFGGESRTQAPHRQSRNQCFFEVSKISSGYHLLRLFRTSLYFGTSQ
jgi:hypothetical protein